MSEPKTSAPGIESADAPTTADKHERDEKTGHDIEAASLADDAPKGSYSKLSVWLMVLFSGLAIGSDG